VLGRDGVAAPQLCQGGDVREGWPSRGGMVLMHAQAYESVRLSYKNRIFSATEQCFSLIIN
jgi:hypothetical protein